MIYVITLSNKPDLLPDAIESVRQQTRPAVHVVGYDTCWEWANRYPPAAFYNDIVQGLSWYDYVVWLSDDDILHPEFVATLAAGLDGGHDAVYCPARHVLVDEDGERLHRMLPEHRLPVFNSQNQPSGKLDGGQIMVKASALQSLGFPYAPEEHTTARYADGILLNRLANMVGIHPVTDAPLVTLRTTGQSAHTRPSTLPGRGVAPHDWRVP